MNPAAAFLIVVAVGSGLFLVIGLGYWIVTRNAGVRRREYQAMRTERNQAWTALNAIEKECSSYSDIDSVLAAQIRLVLVSHNTQRMEVQR
jgi:hypothetical protein